MAGEADYALANELLTREIERYGAAHPACRALAVEWSVWSGVGMGERLGKLDALAREGIRPIPVGRGLESLLDLVRRPRAATPVAVVVAGRFGEPPTVDLDRPALPFLRFLERERFSVPGVELIVEADLGGDSDPYLSDHVYSGERLFPAVLGLEAMAQVAGALVRGRVGGAAGAPPVPVFEPIFEPIFEKVRFDRPVSVPEGERVTLRLAALTRDPGRVEVVLRSSATGFQLDHFRALCRFDRPPDEAPASPERGAEAPLPLDPARDLYGGLLFHRGRFRRLRTYRRLRATECAAEISPDGSVAWFGRTHPGALVLGDPAARDAAIHAVQACIPQATVLPVGVERLEAGALDAGRAHTVRARERSRDGRTLVFDLEILDEEGRRVERWTGLALRAVDERPAPPEWPPDLLAPYLERRLAELLPGADLQVAIGRREGGAAAPGDFGDSAGRRAASDRVLAEVLGVGREAPAPLTRRPDGRPDDAAGRAATATHFAGWVLAVSGPGPVGCDAEPVAGREARDWQDLLGPERSALAELLAAETGEDRDLAATRVWTAVETLKKAGLSADAPLVFEGRGEDGWLILRSGRLALTSLVTRARGVEAPVAMAFLGAASADGRERAVAAALPAGAAGVAS
jgi:enediyne polyketide synthase